MKKFHLLIAALHASALAGAATIGGVGAAAQAQNGAETRAYLEALSLGTPEAMDRFLQAYPHSTLPGSELGASLAAGLDKPTGAIGGGQGNGLGGGNNGNGRGNGSHDSNGGGLGGANGGDGIY